MTSKRSGKRAREPFSTRWRALSLVCILSSTLTVLQCGPQGRDTSPRPLLLRLSSDVDYAPCPAPQEGRCTGTSPRALEAQPFRAESAPAVLAARPDLPTLEKLIRRLEDSTDHNGSISKRQDLAVAYVLASQASSDPSHLLQAWDINESAIQAVSKNDSKRSAALHFNRALLLRDLALPKAAQVQWQVFLEHETHPLWREEAVASKNALTARAMPPSEASTIDCSAVPSATDSIIELLRQWNQARGAAGLTPSLLAGTQQTLQGLETCFPALEDSSLARALRQLMAASNPDLEALLPQYLQAIDAFEKRDLDQTLAFLTHVGSRKELENSLPLVGWIDILDASWSLYDGQPARALDLVQALIAEDRVADPWILARAHWIAALTSGRLGLLGEANRHYWQAGRYLENLGEPIQMATLRARLAESYELLGRRAQAWNHRLQGLRLLASFGEQDRRPSALWEAALAAHDQKRFALSLLFLDEAAEILEAGEDLPQSAQVHSLRALVSSELGLLDTTQEALTRTQQILPKISSGTLKQRAYMQLALAEAGRTRLDQSPDAALSALDKQIMESERTGHVLDVLTLRYARSRIFRLFNRIEEEEAELRSIVFAATEIRGSIQQAHLDRSYSAAAMKSFARLVDLTAQRQRADEALLILDASMAYRDRLGRSGLETRWSTAWSQQIPEGQWIVVYHLGQTDLISWVLDSEGLTLSRRRLSLEDRTQLVVPPERLPSEEQLNALYRLLLEPLWLDGKAPKELLTLAQGPLAKIPFAALRPEPGTPYLIERMAVGRLVRLTSPSVERQARSAAHREPRVFAYGSSRLPHGPFSYLPPLPSVRREIDFLKTVFPKATVALDRDLTRDVLRERVQSAEIFYFAGHSLAHPDDPWMSLLLLHGPDSAALTGEELGALDLSRMQAVILAACNTASVRDNGLAPLAVPLLEAGANSVFGSLWKIPDSSAPQVTGSLAEALRDGTKPLWALREAQIRQLEGHGASAGDAVWAGWQVYVRPPLTVSVAE